MLGFIWIFVRCILSIFVNDLFKIGLDYYLLMFKFYWLKKIIKLICDEKKYILYKIILVK